MRHSGPGYSTIAFSAAPEMDLGGGGTRGSPPRPSGARAATSGSVGCVRPPPIASIAICIIEVLASCCVPTDRFARLARPARYSAVCCHWA